jgi:CshA-type fibril repeat protein
VTDTNGTAAAATMTVTVGTPPTATPDAGTTPQNVNITVDPLANDAAGSSDATLGTLFPSSVALTSPSATDAGRTLVVPGEGTYRVDAITGAVTFDPEPAFTGAATPVGYRVFDSFGNSADSTIAITVTPIAPYAADDAGHTPFRTPVTAALVTNDSAGAATAPLVPGSVVFTSAAATNAGKTLDVAGEGSYQVNGDGSVTFTPDAGFSGAAGPVGYRILDANGTAATASLVITVGAPPAANPDLGTTPQDVTITVPLLGNDEPGTDGAGGAGTLDPGSVVFTDPAAGNGGRSLTVAGEGSYTIDPATGAVTFDPEPGFTGTGTAVAYRVTDSFGHTADSTVTITVSPIVPAAADDANHTPHATPVTTTVLGNDAAGAASAPLVPGSVVISSPGATDGGKTLAVPGEGTWTVRPDGSIRFAPEAGFSGPATIAYQVSDANGTPATATLTVTVGAAPAASDDLGDTPQNVDVTIAPLGNDTPGDDGDGHPGAFDPATLVFTSTDATDGGRTLAIPGEGTWTIDPATGEVVFDPEPAFTGAATPVDYQVQDSFGHVATATIAITVTPVTPIAGDDTATTPYRTPVTLPLLDDDAPGAPTSPLVPSGAVFTSPDATDGGKTLVVPGQGTFTLAPDGSLTFSPVAGFTGAASPVGYQVPDANGTFAPATVTVTVTPPPAPSAADDANHTPYRTAVTTAVLGNDTAGGLASLQPASIVLTDPAAVNGGKTLAVPGQGTYQVNPDGSITFTPVAGFSGPAAGVGYRVSDELGQSASANLVVTVGTPPVATDDATTTPQNVPVTLTPLANDTAGDDGAGTSAPLVASSVVLTSGSATDGGHTLVVAGEGTWTVDPISGALTFAPEPAFTGTTTAVAYSVADGFGNRAQALATVEVTPITPAAIDDAATTPFRTPVTTSLPANDSAGAASAPLVPGSVVLVDLAATAGGTRLAVAGEGTFVVHADGTVTFTPEPGFSGATTPVTYRVADTNGTTAEAVLVVTVGAPPAASDDNAVTPHDTPVTLHPLGNDTAGDDGAGLPGSLDAASVVFTDAAATDGDHTLVVAGEGTWTIDPATGAVTFDPESGFAGTTSPVGYRVTDSFGNTADAQLTVTVGAPPAASDDATSTPQNVDVTIDLLGNDSPGDDGSGAPGTLLGASVVFTSADATAAGKALSVPGEGVYGIDPVTGLVTFDPEPGFTGAATPVAYRVTDSFGATAAAVLRITVTGIEPTATDDAAATPAATPVTVPVLGNDTEGAPSAPLVPGSVVFTSPDATAGGRTLAVDGEGTWQVNPDGTLTFTPEPGFSGPATPVTYRVEDANGTTGTAVVRVTVGAPPAASDDATTTPQNVPVTLDPLGNDTAGDDGTGAPGTLDATTVVFTSGDATDAGRTLAVPGEGTWTIDGASGAATFTPEPAFTGVTTPAAYRVTDSFGNHADARLRVTITPIVPAATDDAGHTPYLTPVTVGVLGNDTAGAASAPLAPGSVVLTSADATDAGKTLVVPGEGAWTVNPDGSVTFTPVAGFSGPATPVDYRVSDANGTAATAKVTVTVGEPPAATDDVTATRQNVTVTVDPLADDTAGDDGTGAPGTLVAASVVFTSPAATDAGRTLVVAGEGTWSIDPATGAVTFDPEPDFTGAATPVTYRVSDSFGNDTAADIRITVADIVPTAADDAATTPFATPVTVPALGNDAAGDPSAPLVPASVVFTSADATDGGTTLVVDGEGTWTVDPATGAIRFAPDAGFSGAATPVQYRVSDTNGTPVAAMVRVTVGAPPAAADDSTSTPQNVTVTLCPPCNDAAGDDGAGTPGTLDVTSVVFTSPAATDGGLRLVVDGEGTWTIDAATGTVTFDPETAFTGVTAAVPYRITDSFGNVATAHLTVTVDPVVPEAAADSGSAPYGSPVTISVLGNDLPGDDSAPLVLDTLVFTSPDATDGGKTLVVPGEGTWTVNPDGTITFTPVAGFSGTTSPVAYEVADANGMIAASTVTAVIGAGPSASADQVHRATPGGPVVISVLGNDAGGSGCSLQPESLVLLGGDPAAPLSLLTVAGEGYWTADIDGTLTFVPETGFNGWSGWVTYRITDSCGNPVTAQARAFVPKEKTAVDSDSDSLAYTGADVAGPIGLGVALLVSGALLLAWRRRREA